MTSPDDSEKILKKLIETPSGQISEAFANQQGLTDTDREIQKKDKENAYALRKLCNEILQQILNYLPRIVHVILWTVVGCGLFVLIVYVWHIRADEKKLFDVIWNVIYLGLVGATSQFISITFFKK